MPLPMSPADFEQLVSSALDSLPPEIADRADNVVVLVEDSAPQTEPDLLGLYDGVALTDRQANHAGYLPDRIVLFRDNLLAMCDTPEELVREVRITVVHEIAHHFGISDARLGELGYA